MKLGSSRYARLVLEILSLCPFAVGTVIWQGQGGAFTLTTCVKGTFKLAHGRDALLADEQEPIGGDRYYAGNAGGLYAPSDIAPYKPRSDVLLVGHAYAPGGKPVDALVARFTVGDLTKSIGIIGDRLWTEGPYGLEPSTPAPFVRMPLRYERAARGVGNPIGVDLAAPPLAGARALPNLEAVDDEAGSTLTVGFGPIPPAWGPRRNLLHDDAVAWVAAGCRGTVPDGFDFGFYNAAPRDQQVDLLRHSAKIVLENLHPEHARLETRLPNIRPKAFLVDRLTRRGNEIALRCDTIWIDTDRGIAVVTWRGLTGVETGDARALGAIAVAAEMKGKELRWKHVERLLAEEGLTSADTESFTMSDVNPLNVRYDGVMTEDVPARASELPVPSVAGAFAASLASPAIGAPPDAGVDDSNVETTTQRISVHDVRARAAQAARPTAPSVSEFITETTHTEVPTVQIRTAPAERPSVPNRAEK
ncbi:MAG: DUF2169 domain-containing protein, partial [Polyangiaceae bacterium]|nr:DUF2169 domain-containing protein [Polyangiaceae bacterium]